MELTIEYIMLIVWLISVASTLFSKSSFNKLISGLLLTYVTLILFNNYNTLFGDQVFVIAGLVISLSGIIEFIKKTI